MHAAEARLRVPPFRTYSMKPPCFLITAAFSQSVCAIFMELVTSTQGKTINFQSCYTYIEQSIVYELQSTPMTLRKLY